MGGIILENVSVKYHNGVVALDDVSFEVENGESVALLGANGAGKSTLLECIVGLTLHTGKIRTSETEVCEENITEVRKVAQLVMQDPNDQLFTSSVYEDVAFGPINFGMENIDQIVEHTLGLVGMEGMEERSPAELSFGQKKRVALASVLAISPEILLLDEPSSGLDGRGKRQLAGYLTQTECTRVIATHDTGFALAATSRAILLDAGKTVADGTTEEIVGCEELLKKHGVC